MANTYTGKYKTRCDKCKVEVGHLDPDGRPYVIFSAVEDGKMKAWCAKHYKSSRGPRKKAA